MPDEHARLSPSGAARWLSCPASVLLIESRKQEGVVDASSPWAEEGTRAHDLAYLEASLAFGLMERAEYAQRRAEWHLEANMHGEELADLLRHVRGYIDLIRQALEQYPDSQLRLEQRVHTGVPHCWGTADAIIVSPRHVRVIDLKYGQGVAVDAYENPQLMLYGCGALEKYGDLLGETEHVEVTIYQPRTGRSVSTYSRSAAGLRAWRDYEVKPVAEQALQPGAPFGPSERACRFCPVAGECRARTEAMLAQDFGTDAALLSPEEVSAALAAIPSIKAWCTAVEELALRRAWSEGKPIPGWKVVRGNSLRRVPKDDIPHAIQILIDAGYTAEQVAQFRLKSLGALEKLVGKKELAELLDGVLVKPEGGPILVPEGDGRPAINPNTEAMKEFADADDDE